MEEIWKPVCGYEDFYDVSNLGNVRSKPRTSNVKNGSWERPGRILKPQKRKHGYLSVWLYTDKAKTQVSVHRLVAEAFCNREDGKDEVNHLNEDKTDNRACNLEWCNRSENCSYGEKLKESRKKWRNNNRSKPIAQYTLEGELVREYPSIHEAERVTGFNASNIVNAVKGRTVSSFGYKWCYLTYTAS